MGQLQEDNETFHDFFLFQEDGERVREGIRQRGLDRRTGTEYTERECTTAVGSEKQLKCRGATTSKKRPPQKKKSIFQKCV